MAASSPKPATGELASTRRVPFDAVSFMNAPVAFCASTVPRTQGSVTVTWANAGVAISSEARMLKESFFMSGSPVQVVEKR